MSFPLFDLVKDLAVVRAGEDSKVDPDQVEAFEARKLRRRLAGLGATAALWIAIILGGWARSWIVGVAVLAILGTGLWLYAERGFYRRKSSSSTRSG